MRKPVNADPIPVPGCFKRSDLLRALIFGVGLGTSVAVNTASAFGLGELIVKSSLGAPLRAMVAVRGEIAGRERLDAKCFRLADGDAAEDIPVLTQGTLRLQQSSGETYLVVEGKRPLNEPVVQINLLVGCGAELKRTYTALIDPLPDVADNGSGGSNGSTSSVGRTTTRAEVVSPVRPDADGLNGSASTWVTSAGDSAASIAKSRYPKAGVLRKQFLQALREANPDVAFGARACSHLTECSYVIWNLGRITRLRSMT